ncbi:hypothetical protein [Luteimonas sp. e5]
MTPVERLLELAGHDSPRFVDAASAGARITPLRHQFQPAASTAALAWLNEALNGASDALLDLYRKCDGAVLFCNVDDPDECLFFLPIAMMEAAKAECHEWLTMGLDEDDEPDDESDPDEILGVPSFWPGAVVFAGFGHAPERLFVAVDGPFRGQVFCHEHDGAYTRRVAMSVAELLQMLVERSAEFMRDQYGVGYFDVEHYETA